MNQKLIEALRDGFFAGDDFDSLSVAQCQAMGKALAENLDIPLVGEKAESVFFGLIIYSIECAVIEGTKSSLIDFLSHDDYGIDLKAIEDKVCELVQIPFIGESKERAIISAIIEALGNFSVKGQKLI